MLDDSFFRFLIIFVSTLAVAVYGLQQKSSQLYRLIMIANVLGVFVYSGLCGIYVEMPFYHIVNYVIFLISLTYSLRFSYRVLNGVNRTAGRKLQHFFSKIDKSFIIWLFFVFFFVFIHLLNLLIPENRLALLFNPPSPDLISAFNVRFERSQDTNFTRIIEYCKVLVFPLFLISMYRFRDRIYFIVLSFLSVFYISYVDYSYASRGEVFSYIMIICLGFWQVRPKSRKYLIILGLLIIPIFLFFSYLYQIVRLGGTVDLNNSPIWTSIWSIIEQEITYPLTTGIPLVESEKYVNLSDYFTWLVTLPIPKILTGQIVNFRVNDQISSIVLGLYRGDRGFYIVLPGLVMESIFFYGKYFFWLHAVSIGFVSAMTIRLLENIPCMAFLYGHLFMLFSYVLNRAGVAALFPMITNGLIVIYAILILNLLKKKTIKLTNT